MWVQLPPTASKIKNDNLFIIMRNGVLILGLMMTSFSSGCLGLPPTEADLREESLRELEETTEPEVVIIPGYSLNTNDEGEAVPPPEVSLELCECRFQVVENPNGLICFGIRCSDGCPPETTRCAESVGGCTLRRF